MSGGYKKYLRNVLPRMAKHPEVDEILCVGHESLGIADFLLLLYAHIPSTKEKKGFCPRRKEFLFVRSLRLLLRCLLRCSRGSFVRFYHHICSIAEFCVKEGCIPYKTPIWMTEIMKKHINPGWLKIFDKVKNIMDPNGIFNPGRWRT